MFLWFFEGYKSASKLGPQIAYSQIAKKDLIRKLQNSQIATFVKGPQIQQILVCKFADLQFAEHISGPPHPCLFQKARKSCMVEEPTHIKQLSVNHVCKIGLN